jgi:hypothetical protein
VHVELADAVGHLPQQQHGATIIAHASEFELHEILSEPIRIVIHSESSPCHWVFFGPLIGASQATTMSALLACAATLLSFANQPDVHFPSYLPPVECGAKGCAEPGCAIVGAATGKDDGACLASFVPCMPGACTPNRKDSCPQIRRRRALGALQFMVTAIAAWLVLADCMALHMSNNTCIYVCCMQIPWVKSQNHVCTAYKPLTQVMRQDET